MFATKAADALAIDLWLLKEVEDNTLIIKYKGPKSKSGSAVDKMSTNVSINSIIILINSSVIKESSIAALSKASIVVKGWLVILHSYFLIGKILGSKFTSPIFLAFKQSLKFSLTIWISLGLEPGLFIQPGAYGLPALGNSVLGFQIFVLSERLIQWLGSNQDWSKIGSSKSLFEPCLIPFCYELEKI